MTESDPGRTEEMTHDAMAEPRPRDRLHRSESPDEYFDPLDSAIRSYIEAFNGTGDEAAVASLERMQGRVAGTIAELEEQYEAPSRSLRHTALAATSPTVSSSLSDASTFDDLDELAIPGRDPDVANVPGSKSHQVHDEGWRTTATERSTEDSTNGLTGTTTQRPD